MAAKKKAPREDSEQAPEAAAAEQQAPQDQVAQEDGTPAEQPAAEQPAAEQPPAEQPQAADAIAEQPAAEQPAAEQPAAEQPAAEQPEAADAVAEQPPAEPPSEQVEAPAEVAQPTAGTEQQPAAEAASPGGPGASEQASEAAEAETPRAKPAVPGAHLEVDIVPEGVDPLGRGEEEYEDRYAIEDGDLAPVAVEEREEEEEESEEVLTEPIASAAIDLAAGARYRATGKRKTAIARVTLRPGSGSYLVNGRTLEEHFPRLTLQRNIRQPLETVGYQERMDVVARLHGGGISAQAGALRHGVSRALLEADPNLRGELKRRGFLTRDSRAKERKKAGLKKARKRPQFSKR
jgi:small subunit ribosomal protein S9